MNNKSKRKEIILHKDGYKVVFWLEGEGRNAEVICNAFKGTEETPCLDWAFPKIPGNNLTGNSAIYLDQAVIYAKNPPK